MEFGISNKLRSLWNVCLIFYEESMAVADPVAYIYVDLYLKFIYLYICCTY